MLMKKSHEEAQVYAAAAMISDRVSPGGLSANAALPEWKFEHELTDSSNNDEVSGYFPIYRAPTHDAPELGKRLCIPVKCPAESRDEN